MNLATFSKYVVNGIGWVSIVLAFAGIGFSMLSTNNINELQNVDYSDPQFLQFLEGNQEGGNEEVMKVMSQMSSIVSSFEFKAFFWCFFSLGLAVNLALLFISYQLIRVNQKYVRWYLGLMLFSVFYIYGAPWFTAINPESMLSLQFSAAWGIGNMGLNLYLLTYFWFWAPLLLLLVTIITKNHNKANSHGQI
jgi:hypothetical protein